jgi:hypothetical protein
VLTLDANPPVSDPKIAANAEMLAGSQDAAMSLICEARQTRASSPVEPEEGEANKQSNILIRLKIANRSTDLSVGYVLDIPVGIVIRQHKTVPSECAK